MHQLMLTPHFKLPHIKHFLLQTVQEKANLLKQMGKKEKEKK